MNKSRFVCLLGAVTLCTAGWAKDIPFKAVFIGNGGAATVTAPCSVMKTTIEAQGIVTGIVGLVRTSQTHCVDGTDPLSATSGVIAASNTSGDSYSATYSGKLVPTATSDADKIYTIDGQFTITGGTGSYANAKGGGTTSGLQNTASGYIGLILSGTVTVTETTPPPTPKTPVADAGPDVTTGFTEFTLDGSKSYDPEGGILIYSWRNVGKTATIIGTNVANPRIQAISAFGLYTFELTVTNSRGQSSVDTVNVMYIGN